MITARVFPGLLLHAVFLFAVLAIHSRSVEAIERIRVFPVIFFPQDAKLSKGRIDSAYQKMSDSLVHVQSHFRRLLISDTFLIEQNPDKVFRSARPHRYFLGSPNAKPDSAHLMLGELLRHYGETRESTRRVYVLVYVRPGEIECSWIDKHRMCIGGGRTIDSFPEPGGGIVQMEFSSLMENKPYRFLSTVTHEIGHGFGLTHVDCFNYDMRRNDSIMSYNDAHLPAELGKGKFYGNLNPEEYALLSLHRRAFPRFRYDPALHNPTGRPISGLMRCLLGPMDSSLGLPPRKGYRLYYDGKKVSGPEAALYTYQAAEDNCRWNRKHRPGIDVGCTFNGRPLSYWRKRIPTR